MSLKADFIRIPPAPETGREQTMPTEPERRIPQKDIQVMLCEEKDMDKFAEGMYTCFSEKWWARREPVALRPSQATRQKRLADRVRFSFSNPDMYWVKAVYLPTNEIIGMAGWVGPNHPIHNIFLHSAFDFYDWRTKFGVDDAAFEEMWSAVDIETWDGDITNNDNLRREVMGDEPHWYLAPVLTWPEWQGRGVAKLLLQWGIDRADATDPVTPMYLESTPYARAVYMHVGFKPVGKANFVRRGPAIVRGLEAEDEGEVAKSEEVKGGRVDIEVVAKEAEAQLA